MLVGVEVTTDCRLADRHISPLLPQLFVQLLRRLFVSKAVFSLSRYVLQYRILPGRHFRRATHSLGLLTVVDVARLVHSFQESSRVVPADTENIRNLLFGETV